VGVGFLVSSSFLGVTGLGGTDTVGGCVGVVGCVGGGSGVGVGVGEGVGVGVPFFWVSPSLSSARLRCMDSSKFVDMILSFSSKRNCILPELLPWEGDVSGHHYSLSLPMDYLESNRRAR
jgi:hypothetical protein